MYIFKSFVEMFYYYIQLANWEPQHHIVKTFNRTLKKLPPLRNVLYILIDFEFENLW